MSKNSLISADRSYISPIPASVTGDNCIATDDYTQSIATPEELSAHMHQRAGNLGNGLGNFLSNIAYKLANPLIRQWITSDKAPTPSLDAVENIAVDERQNKAEPTTT